MEAIPTLPVRPRFRGVVHQWSFFVALAAGSALVVWAPAGRATAAAAIYAAALAGLLGTSALYHRVTWQPRARTWLRRLDHSMIFVLIAGTYTPFALLVLDGTLAKVVLVGVWSGAVAGIVFTLIWPNAPKWLTAGTYVALGWFSIVAVPSDHRAGRRGGAGAAGRGRDCVYGRSGGVRAPAPGPAARDLRLPRDLPRARRGRRRGAFHGSCGFCVAGRRLTGAGTCRCARNFP